MLFGIKLLHGQSITYCKRRQHGIIPFAGIPLVLGVVVFVGFWYANTQLERDLPPTIVAYATQALLLPCSGMLLLLLS